MKPSFLKSVVSITMLGKNYSNGNNNTNNTKPICLRKKM